MNELENFITMFKNIINVDGETLTDETLKAILDNLDQNLSGVTVIQSVNQIVKNLEDQNLTKAEAYDSIAAVKEVLKEAMYGEQVLTGNKKTLAEAVTSKLFNIFDEAVDKYHSYAIELPMTVTGTAQVPTYAHDTDAAADIYASENYVLAPHTLGNKIHTGIKIQLPEGWLAMILPRSSMGSKTPLRLSNSVGLIDSGYRGELGVLYDNIGDESYTINIGDRIAQLLVMPSYRFQPKVVDELTDSDRGEGGFGASGK